MCCSDSGLWYKKKEKYISGKLPLELKCEATDLVIAT